MTAFSPPAASTAWLPTSAKSRIEVTLRIDETTNAKLRVTLNSVAQVLGDEPPADTPSK